MIGGTDMLTWPVLQEITLIYLQKRLWLHNNPGQFEFTEYKTFWDSFLEKLLADGKITMLQLYDICDGKFRDEECLSRVKHFFLLHKKNYVTPIIGGMYYPIGVTCIAHIEYIEIRYTTAAIQLIDSPSDYVTQDLIGKENHFPDSVNKNGGVAATFFFKEKDASQQFKTLSLLSLSEENWKVECIEI